MFPEECRTVWSRRLRRSLATSASSVPPCQCSRPCLCPAQVPVRPSASDSKRNSGKSAARTTAKDTCAEATSQEHRVTNETSTKKKVIRGRTCVGASERLPSAKAQSISTPLEWKVQQSHVKDISSNPPPRRQSHHSLLGLRNTAVCCVSVSVSLLCVGLYAVCLCCLSVVFLH